MKEYSNRTELKNDIQFIQELNINQSLKDDLINDLVSHWKYTSPDSPWYSNDNNDNGNGNNDKRVHFNENLISNEWCGEHTIFEDVKVRSNHYNLRNI